MEKFKRSFSMRKKRDATSESSKPHQWQEDERKVREGTCSFQVKYLGCIEVFESRGIQICEEAVKALKSRKSRSSWSLLSFRKKRDDAQQSKSNHHRAVLYVTGDALRVVDEISKGLIVDQTIEKVSFCAPDRNHEKGFAYICRDGTTRRWMCHGFLAVKESGERLSHAVGCAFAICLEKKQQREKEKVTVTYNENGTSFTRLGSFRQTTLTERLQDPQSAILAEPVPVKQIENPFALKRPHAPVDIMERQSSFRNFPKMAESSPFKRNISLRVNELPSTLERHRQVAAGIIGPEQQFASSAGVISVILEAEEQPDLSPVTSPANQLSDEFAGLSTGTVGHNPQSTTQPAFATPLVNNFTTQAPAINPLSANLQPMSTAFAHPAPQQAVNLASANLNPSVQPYPRQPIPNAAMQGVNLPSQPALPQPLQHVSPVIPSAAIPNMVAVNTNPSMQRAPLAASPAMFMPQPVPAQLVSQFSGNQFLQNGAVAPVRVSNPWADSTRLQSYPASTVAAVVVSSANASTASGKISDAEYWLNSTASQIDPFAAAPHVGGRQTSVRARPGVSGVGVGGAAEQVLLPHFGAVAPSIEPTLTLHSPPFAGHSQQVTTTGMVVGAASHPQAALVNSPMMFATSAHTPQAGTIAAAAAAASVHPQHQQPVNSMGNANFNATVTARLDSGIPKTAPDAALDPFESAWAAKSTSRGAMPVSAASNPFQGGMDKVTPAFQLKL